MHWRVSNTLHGSYLIDNFLQHLGFSQRVERSGDVLAKSQMKNGRVAEFLASEGLEVRDRRQRLLGHLNLSTELADELGPLFR